MQRNCLLRGASAGGDYDDSGSRVDAFNEAANSVPLPGLAVLLLLLRNGGLRDGDDGDGRNWVCCGLRSDANQDAIAYGEIAEVDDGGTGEIFGTGSYALQADAVRYSDRALGAGVGLDGE